MERAFEPQETAEDISEIVRIAAEADRLEERFHARVNLDAKVSSLLTHVSVMTALCGLFLQFGSDHELRKVFGIDFDVKAQSCRQIAI